MDLKLFIFVVISFLKLNSPIDCAVVIPHNPCPEYFHYEFDGQHGVVVTKIPAGIYNRFRSNKIQIRIWLTVNRFVPNNEVWPIKLYRSLQDTHREIAARRPIMYRIEIPFYSDLPALLKINVNGIQMCISHRIRYTISEIELKYTFYTSALNSEPNDDNSHTFQMDLSEHESMPTDLHLFSDAKKSLLNRLDEDDFIKVNRFKNRLKPTGDSAHCGTYDGEFKYTQLISGGEKIVPGTWPWLVAIFRKESKANNLVFQCTGNLITNRLVLTAAHCFKMDSKQGTAAAKEFVLAFGRHDIRDWTESNTVMSDIEEIIVHPNYLSNEQANFFDADIALLITKNYINYNLIIRPICLWPENVDNSISIIEMNGTLVGWGQPFENLDTNTPRRLTLPVVRNQKCFPSEKSPRPKRRVFCAGTEKQGHAPCNGDSGSGFAIWANGAWFLRGIVSAALGDPILNRCDLNTYVIFTDIVHYLSWIAEFM